LKAKEMESKKKGEPKESTRKEEPILAMSDLFERERERERERIGKYKRKELSFSFTDFALCTLQFLLKKN
jgi:hypothetical protein